MRNWSTDENKISKISPRYKKWHAEQLLTFGFNEGDKLEKKYLLKNLKTLNISKDIKDYVLTHAEIINICKNNINDFRNALQIIKKTS